MNHVAKFTAEIKEKLNKAISQFNSNFSADEVIILFTLKGTRAATAFYDMVDGIRTFGLNFNIYNIEHHYDEMVNTVIPHEIAHLICFDKQHFHPKHDNVWKDICLSLGGTAERTHKMTTKKARITKKYVYMIKNHKFTISSLHHKKVQLDELFFHVYIDGIQCAITPRHFTGEILRH
jgi:predicted SprT family Zn-dependent metalloprotease